MVVVLYTTLSWLIIVIFKSLDSAGPLSPRAAAALKAEIERERAQLLASKDMAESEKNKAQEELSNRESELKSAQEQHDELNKKLKNLQSKVCTYISPCSKIRMLLQ